MTSFTAVVIRTSVLTESAPLDESYGSYYEDVEWSLRSAVSGSQGIYQPQATGVHIGSATSGVRSSYSCRQLLRNRRRLAHQHLLPRFTRESRIAHMLLRAQIMRAGQWPRLRAEAIAGKQKDDRLAAVVHRSEAELYRLQVETGMDALWQWYFRLAGRPE